MRQIAVVAFVALATAACGGSPTSSTSLTGIGAGGDATFSARAVGDDVASKPPAPGSPRLTNEQCTPSPVVVPGSVGTQPTRTGYRAHMAVQQNPHANTYMGEAMLSRQLPDGSWTAPVSIRSRDLFTRATGANTAVYEVEVAAQNYAQRVHLRVRVLFDGCQSNWTAWVVAPTDKLPDPPQPGVVPQVVPEDPPLHHKSDGNIVWST